MSIFENLYRLKLGHQTPRVMYMLHNQNVYFGRIWILWILFWTFRVLKWIKKSISTLNVVYFHAVDFNHLSICQKGLMLCYREKYVILRQWVVCQPPLISDWYRSKGKHSAVSAPVKSRTEPLRSESDPRCSTVQGTWIFYCCFDRNGGRQPIDLLKSIMKEGRNIILE